MWFFFFLAVIAGPALLYCLAMAGRRLRARAAIPAPQNGVWPSVGLVIPCAGTHPDMERALRSLIGQNYAGDRKCVLVTATDTEPAAALVGRLAAEFEQVTHVVAGQAHGCGQKNHNSLQGVRALGSSVEVYAFCDSTHTASPDFLSRLVAPIASGKAVFTTGYHEVVPRDRELVTLAYTFCVLCMRLLQGLSKFTQPWGGAMAIQARAFAEHRIGEFWAGNVVDDCSLTTYLQERQVEVCLCPGALLRTRAEHHKHDVWLAWLERQILFLKFCVPAQWWLLGGLLVFMAIVPTLAFLAAVGFVLGLSGWGSLVCAGFYLICTAMALSALRPLLPHHVPLMRWLRAYWLTCFCACTTFLRTIPASGILWHGIWYEVGRRGRVLSVTRR